MLRSVLSSQGTKVQVEYKMEERYKKMDVEEAGSHHLTVMAHLSVLLCLLKKKKRQICEVRNVFCICYFGRGVGTLQELLQVVINASTIDKEANDLRVIQRIHQQYLTAD